MKKTSLISVFFAACSCATLQPKTGVDTRVASVRVVTVRGGGTGSIYSSSFLGSQILTNKHVCELVKEVGSGIIATNDGQEFPVATMRESNVHDLCLIKVDANLGVDTQVASSAPQLGSKATISGHPKLQPHTRTVGDFSNYVKIQVVVGTEPCTEEDMSKITDPFDALMCALGGKPIVKKFDSQYVSALISPGSSGSAVYDEDGNIAGVVFAGSGDLSFAYIVPWEYVHDFLEYEVKGLEPKEPKAKISASLSPNITITRAILLYDEEEKRVRRAEQIDLLYKRLYGKLKKGETCLDKTLFTP